MSLGSPRLEEWLSRPDVHHRWMADYLSPDNDCFFELAFDSIARVLRAPRDAAILDVGCGTCAHAIRLARRGFVVQAVDFSEAALKIAAARIADEKLEARIRLCREDLLGFSFEDRMFDCILCWGVLMHVADVETGIAELARVLKPGGLLVLSEGNMHSLQAVLVRLLRPLLRRGYPPRRKSPAGLENWSVGSAGPQLTREANIRWLIEQFKSKGFTVRSRFAGQFIEAYTRVSSPHVKALIHSFNNWWFRYVGNPHLSFGNIVVLQKETGR
jgi:ubiquinone/menaquinone biosynthesis C-methylase UbiE